MSGKEEIQRDGERKGGGSEGKMREGKKGAERGKEEKVEGGGEGRN